jgi:hypothetical protein
VSPRRRACVHGAPHSERDRTATLNFSIASTTFRALDNWEFGEPGCFDQKLLGDEFALSGASPATVFVNG